MKKSVTAVLHIGFWFCYLLVVLVVLGIIYDTNTSNNEKEITEAFINVMFMAIYPSIISFYGFYYLLFPYSFSKKKYLLSALYGFLISLFGAIQGFIFLYYFNLNQSQDCENLDPVSIFFGMVSFITIISFLSGVVGLILKGFVTWFEEVKQKEQLKQKNLETEIALVKSQLDPHFLFNTINNIDVLILRDAHKASDYLNNLSDIMRFMLFETKTNEIPLAKEMEYIQKYIELQKIRTANENYVNFKLTGSSKGKLIAPMVFIPFIENAFKHTNNKKIEDAIDITIKMEGNKTIMICENKYDTTRKQNVESHGLGNKLIEKRLNLIYPNAHILKITDQNNLYKVYLEINHG